MRSLCAILLFFFIFLYENSQAAARREKAKCGLDEGEKRCFGLKGFVLGLGLRVLGIKA